MSHLCGDAPEWRCIRHLFTAVCLLPIFRSDSRKPCRRRWCLTSLLLHHVIITKQIKHVRTVDNNHRSSLFYLFWRKTMDSRQRRINRRFIHGRLCLNQHGDQVLGWLNFTQGMIGAKIIPKLAFSYHYGLRIQLDHGIWKAHHVSLAIHTTFSQEIHGTVVSQTQIQTFDRKTNCPVWVFSEIEAW